MKKLIFIYFIIGFSYSTLAQGLFYDNIGKNTWILLEYDSSSTFEKKDINLSKLRVEKDSLIQNVYFWKFGEFLDIQYFQSTLKSESLISRFEYEIIEEKSKTYIRIYTDNLKANFNDYSVGITATGNNVLLQKRKKKKTKS